jgi:hypothetical protein
MLHTVLTHDLIEISHQSNENLDALCALIKEDFAGKEDLKSSYVFTLLCELVWLNSSILLLLRRDLQDISFKDKTQKEVLVSEKTLGSLTNLSLSRWAAINELNSLSYSLSMH